MKKEIKKQGTEAVYDGKTLSVKYEGKELKREFHNPFIEINLEDESITVNSKKDNKKLKMLINTWVSHIKNMIKGVKESYEYKLRICSSHFPISVKVSGNTFEISNFIGEKVPRKAKIMPGSEVSVEGDLISVKSQDVESAGQTAGNIECATRIIDRDRRRFQDGIYIIKKPRWTE
ncbi:MAG: 50S ribosomal protein L6 [Candidatus Nanoarchaeia archaeon]|nr:50S ribosomal protein L6 [Candidatus Nanoarchaeia archaeon]